MRPIRFLSALLFVAAATAPAAYALTFSDSPSTHDASNFADPDDNVPFTHLSDNGQPAGFQSGSGFSVYGNSGNSGPDAFTRAQQRMQQ